MAKILDERKKGLEEEYFRRKEQEALEKTRQRLAAEQSEPNKVFYALSEMQRETGRAHF